MTPAEKLTCTSPSCPGNIRTPGSALASLSASAVARTWRGGPDRYMVSSGIQLLVVRHDQRVGELDPESVATVLGEGVELADQADGALELEVVVERLRHQFDVVVTELVVHDVANPVEPEQRRVELHDDIDIVFVDEVLGDGLDLVGWAAMEGGQRDGVGDRGRKREVGERGEGLRNLRAESLDLAEASPIARMNPATLSVWMPARSYPTERSNTCAPVSGPRWSASGSHRRRISMIIHALTYSSRL